jgi:hypothetical protein
MANTALNGPAHRIMRRMPIGSGGAAQPPDAAPSLDMGGAGLLDTRVLWNTANSSTGAGQAIGWPPPNHPFLDVVPSTASIVAIAAAQVPTTNVHLNLVSSTGAGITVSSSATLVNPFGVASNIIPSGSVFIDSIPVYRRFGTNNFTVVYDAATMLARQIQCHSVGNDSGAAMHFVGFDIYGELIHETVTMGSGATVTTNKAYKGLISATPIGTLSGSNVSLGQADVFGLPIYCAAASNIWGFWNNLILAGAGTFTAGVLTTPSATTGDVRGVYAPGSASDGTKRLTLWAHPVISQMVTSGINVGIFGQPQF